MSHHTVQSLPPKMATSLYRDGLEGKADVVLRATEFLFYRAPNQEIFVYGGDNYASGHVLKLTKASWDAKVAECRKMKGETK